MKNNIQWLPNIDRLEDYIINENYFDYNKLINDKYNDLINDFYNISDPVKFQGLQVLLNGKLLDCNKLKQKNCYNSDFYNCLNCPFEGKHEIFNHICTMEYTKKNLKKKGGSIKLKKEFRTSHDISSTPRVPGEFSIPRTLLCGWIKLIIMNANDINNVIIKPVNTTEYVIELIHRKYRIVLKKAKTPQRKDVFYIKTAYFFTDPKELMELQNSIYIQNALKNKNASSGVSATPCIDL